MKFPVSKGIKSFLILFSAVFLALLFWKILSLYFSFVNPSIWVALGLFVLASFTFFWYRVYKKNPILVSKISLIVLFIILVGYFWYEAIQQENLYADDYRIFEPLLAGIAGYVKALFKTIAVFCIGSFIFQSLESRK